MLPLVKEPRLTGRFSLSTVDAFCGESVAGAAQLPWHLRNESRLPKGEVSNDGMIIVVDEGRTATKPE